MPNPTVIDTLTDDKSMNGKTVVFTAFLKEERSSNEVDETNEGETNPVSPCWYPTTFFFDLQKQRTVWEVYAAEQFIGIQKKKVVFLTNNMWNKVT